MYTIDYLKSLSKLTVEKWMYEHLVDTDGNFGNYASHHKFVNGKMKCSMISHQDFFQIVESHINSDEITFDFIGCEIKGPFNLYMTIQNMLDMDYLNHFPIELKHDIMKHVSHHEYLKNILNDYDGEIPDTKIILGMYYLSYVLDHKNEIYDIILDYKMRVIQYELDM
jgi:hypothetical protein